MANHITNNSGTEYHKTCILYEYMRGTSIVHFIWAGTADLEVFQTEKKHCSIPGYSNNTDL